MPGVELRERGVGQDADEGGCLPGRPIEAQPGLEQLDRPDEPTVPPHTGEDAAVLAHDLAEGVDDRDGDHARAGGIETRHAQTALRPGIGAQQLPDCASRPRADVAARGRRSRSLRRDVRFGRPWKRTRIAQPEVVDDCAGDERDDGRSGPEPDATLCQ
jgi:hypothetical protein